MFYLLPIAGSQPPPSPPQAPGRGDQGRWASIPQIAQLPEAGPEAVGGAAAALLMVLAGGGVVPLLAALAIGGGGQTDPVPGSDPISSTMCLERFHRAHGQGPDSAYEHALAELRALGSSPMSQRYGIESLLEARAYLEDLILSQRLEEVIMVIADQLQQPNQTLANLMNGELDAAKTVSSLTLFGAAGLTSASELLDQIDQKCEITQKLILG